VDAEQVRTEIRQTRASIDRKLELLSSRTSELADTAKDTARRVAAATLMSLGATIALAWWRARMSPRLRQTRHIP
jgi:diacylglycerol kinase